MLNREKISAIFTITLACLLSMVSLALGEERYLTDTTTGAMREGPGSQYKAIKTLHNDQSFEVLETLDGFAHIRTKEGTEGWIQEKFTSTEVPNLPIVRGAIEKDANQGAKKSAAYPVSSGHVAAIAKQSDTALDPQLRKEAPEPLSPKESSEIKRLQADLAEITEKFNQIETSTADTQQQLKDENARLKEELSDLQKNLSQLQQTNISLADKQNIYWFIAGSAVFLLGWLIGKISFRRQRHSSLTL